MLYDGHDSYDAGLLHREEETSIEQTQLKEEKTSSVSVRELLAMEPEPVSWAVEELIPTGLGLIIGPSKLGKSWMALQLALAVASGKEFLGFHTRKGNVLYLALEDNERRLVERVALP